MADENVGRGSEPEDREPEPIYGGRPSVYPDRTGDAGHEHDDPDEAPTSEPEPEPIHPPRPSRSPDPYDVGE